MEEVKTHNVIDGDHPERYIELRGSAHITINLFRKDPKREFCHKRCHQEANQENRI